jgi:acyl-CoA synthetase (AMP-forming)/AMP-acid ligase II
VNQLQPDYAPPEAEHPGQFPYTRGVSAEPKVWTMGQYAGFGTPAESNQRFRALLAAGGTGFSVALDLPTQMGLDSDDPKAAGEVGRVGVAIDSLADVAPQTVIDHCRSRMASYKKPKVAHRVDAFPLNSTGKIAKRVLRDRLESGLAPDEERV